MIYRRLGRTNLSVSLLSLGTGGARRLGQAMGMTLLDQQRLVHHAMDLGVNLIDTAEQYGESESIVGRCLRGIPRNDYFLSTKWSPRVGKEFVPNPVALQASVERSLQRLGTDYIDVMLFHGPRVAEYDAVVDQLYPVLNALRNAGKVRYVGLSTPFVHDPAQEVARIALTEHPAMWDVVMLKYGILNQYAANEILTLAARHDVGVMNMAAVRVKLPDAVLLEALIKKWKDDKLIARNALPDTDPLGWLIHDDVGSVIEAGYRFAAEPSVIATVLTGTSSIEHLNANARCLETPKLVSAHSSRLKALFGGIVEYA
jgi:L-galactose dehydrogenase